MNSGKLSRRAWMNAMGAAAPVVAGLGAAGLGGGSPAAAATTGISEAERMKWWHDARFGMFIHFGLYSYLGHHEWAMEEEGIPISEYELMAQKFNPKPNAARAWASLAKRAGQKYMVMTTKHHEGFCNFDTKHTNYCASKTGPGRDLVREYVDAVRGEGLRLGFYYSLMDWHHPDGVKCWSDESARRRFVDYIHGEVREICSNYGKLDVLWYDVDWPLSPMEWESAKLNSMVRELQPEIIINNRSGLPEDFSTPEQEIRASGGNWESCMTMNDSWGYQRADDNWKSPKTIVRNLVECGRGGGNYLLNIGPKGDGSIPDESVRILEAVGKWMDRNGDTIYTSERCRVHSSTYADFTRIGNTLYMHVHYWPGETVSLGGLLTKVKSARLHASGHEVKFDQEPLRVRFTGLPEQAPDEPVTTIAIECDSEPVQDTSRVRKDRNRQSRYSVS